MKTQRTIAKVQLDIIWAMKILNFAMEMFIHSKLSSGVRFLLLLSYINKNIRLLHVCPEILYFPYKAEFFCFQPFHVNLRWECSTPCNSYNENCNVPLCTCVMRITALYCRIFIDSKVMTHPSTLFLLKLKTLLKTL